MKRLMFACGVLISIAALGFLFAAIWQQRAELDAAFSSENFSVVNFSSSALLFAAIYPLTGAVFTKILRNFGSELRPTESIGVLCVSQISRYLPGNVAQHIFRGGMLAQRNIPLPSVAAAIAVETLLAVIAAGCLAVMSLLATYHNHELTATWSLLAAASACIITLVLFHFPRTFLSKKIKKTIRLETFDGLAISTTAACLATYIFNYLLIGFGLWLLIPDIYGFSTLWLCIGSFAVAWIVGFLAPGLPAGLGAREGILVMLLAPVLGMADAIVVATVHRLSTTTGDVLALFVGATLLHANILPTEKKDNAI